MMQKEKDMTPAQKAEYRENFAAEMAIIVARKELTYDGVSVNDLDAATIAALWRALEIASKGMSKEALNRMVFGEDADEVREAIKVAREALQMLQEGSTQMEDGCWGSIRTPSDSAMNAGKAALARIGALDVGK